MPQPPKLLLYVAPTKAGASLQAATVSQRRASVAARKQFAYFVQNDVVEPLRCYLEEPEFTQVGSNTQQGNKNRELRLCSCYRKPVT